MLRPASFALVAALAACAPADAPGPSRATAADLCVDLFQRYDFLDRTVSERQRDRWSVPPELAWQAQLLRRNGCITLSSDLTLDAAVTPARAGGGSIEPVSVAVGTVTNDADDAAARAFFEAQGLRARSVGKAGLGRRVYVGPVASEGSLAAAFELARAAGFVAPYPVRSW